MVHCEELVSAENAEAWQGVQPIFAFDATVYPVADRPRISLGLACRPRVKRLKQHFGSPQAGLKNTDTAPLTFQ
jgi:hypothetical protein